MDRGPELCYPQGGGPNTEGAPCDAVDPMSVNLSDSGSDDGGDSSDTSETNSDGERPAEAKSAAKSMCVTLGQYATVGEKIKGKVFGREACERRRNSQYLCRRTAAALNL